MGSVSPGDTEPFVVGVDQPAMIVPSHWEQVPLCLRAPHYRYTHLRRQAAPVGSLTVNLLLRQELGLPQ